MRQRFSPLTLAAMFTAALAVLPIASIVFIAAGQGDWHHVVTNVLPRSGRRTLALVAMTCTLATFFATLSAWLVSTFEFPLRRMLSVAVVLPLAIPSYLAAYAFVEFLDFTGPVQSALRAVFGFHSMRDYRFPDIRSTGGAALVLASVLYPYIYLPVRAAFSMQGRTAAEAARTLGSGRLNVFLRVQLPMARPALMIGLTLVTMESLNDIGAVEYLGVQTLTFSVYDSWLNRGNLAGAAQIAVFMLIAVAGLLFLEKMARRRQRFAAAKTTAISQRIPPVALPGGRKWLATAFCALPVLSGFVIPVTILGGFALKRLDRLVDPRLPDALLHTGLISLAVAILAVLCGFVLAYAARVDASAFTRAAVRVASAGYGVPGTVLAIGVLIPLSALDNLIDAHMRSLFGIATGLLLTGSGYAIIHALTVRFLTMAEGTIDAGFHKLSPHMDMASRSLGRTRAGTLGAVLLPNMRPAALTAALLVFIEALKELPATILLRPFNFNTLATLVYEDASRSKVADASVAAMIIIAAGLIPAILVSRSLDNRQ